MVADLTARAATGDELALLPEIEAAADAMFADAGITLPAEPLSVDDLRAAVAVLVVGRPVAGYAQLGVVDGSAHLDQLSVHPAFGRRGFGTALLAAAVDWAREAGHRAITLTTFRDVPWNGPFYLRRGFVEVPEEECGPELRGRRDHERRIGLDAQGPRTVMRRQV